MKKVLLYLLGITIILSSCRSVQKLVDKGEYEEAIELAARKLHGQKNRKTKHVQGLETAFAKIMKRDMDHIRFLKDQDRPENWSAIHDRLLDIKARQHTIEPFLPLVSKDGYVAHFRFVNVNPLIIEAAEGASAYHYNIANDMIARAEDGDKLAARRAYDELNAISRYYRYYKNSEALKDKALYLGRTRTLILSRSTISAYLPVGFHEALLQVDVNDLNSRWQEVHTQRVADVDYDLHAILEIENVDVSPEREKERIYVESKDIKDGYEDVYDTDGNIVRDSLGNAVRTERYRTIWAEIVELLREKAAYVKGNFKVVDVKTGTIVDAKPITTESIFSSYASRYKGDRRALTNATTKRVRDRPERFPSDFDLIWQTADDMKVIMKEELRRNIL